MKSKLFYLIIGLLFFCLGALRYKDSVEVMKFGIASWCFIAFMYADLRYWRVSKIFGFISVLAALVLAALSTPQTVTEVLFGIGAGYLTIWGITVVFTAVLRKFSVLAEDEFAVGSGDPLVFAVIGGFLGYKLLPTILFLASVQGIGAFALAKVTNSKQFFKMRPSEFINAVPFGAFLCLASLELLIFRMPK